MVTRRSEYQRQFKMSTFKKHLPTYYENVAFRNHRRDLENAHTPINWEGSEESDSSSSESLYSVSEQENVESEKCDTESKHLPHNICDDEISQDKQKEIDSLQEKDYVPSDKNLTKDSYDISQSEQNKLNKYSRVQNKYESAEPEEQSESKVNFVKIKRPSRTRSSPKVKAKKSKLQMTQVPTIKRIHLRRPDRFQDIPVARPKSGKITCRRDMCQDIPVARPHSGPITGRPPFLSYGWAELSHHRTHNVLANTDIHPPALNAKKNHEQLMLQKKELKETTEQNKINTGSLFDKRSHQYGSAGWQSEYRDHYPTHDSLEYSKVISSRPLSARLTARERCDWI